MMRSIPRHHAIMGLLIVVAGCGGQPQVSHQNRELIVSLATAVSAKNPAWLDSNEQLLKQRRAEGQCDDQEFKVFSEIIAQARAGDWKAAEEIVYRLRDSQEPTSEDMQNLQSRKLDHNVPKTLKGTRQGTAP